MKHIDLVLPVQNEESNIPALFEEIAQVADSLSSYSFGFLFVDDGSRDGSLECLRELASRDSRVRVIALSRNVGHQLAVTAGLDHANGDAVIIMDTDLQDPPQIIPELISEWEAGFDCVHARRISRTDPVFKRVTAKVFYWWLARVSDVDLPRDVGDFRLVDRKLVLEIREYREADRYLRGLFAYLGHRQTFVDFHRRARSEGKSGYSLRDMIALAAGGVMGFSSAPLRFVRNIGVLIALLAFVGVIYVFAGRLIDPTSTVPGWAFTVISILFVGGVQIVMLSVVGSYVGRIFQQVKDRPLYGIAWDSHAEGEHAFDAKS